MRPVKYRKWLNDSIWPLDGILIGATTMSQSGPGSNGNEEVLLIPKSSILGLLTLFKDAVEVFYSISKIARNVLD